MIRTPRLRVNVVYCDDCVEGMKKYLPSGSIDLVVTSPPYGELRDFKGYHFDFQAMAVELFRAMKKGGMVVWVVGDETKDGSESGESFRQALYFKKLGFNLHDTMIYEKSNMVWPGGNRYHQVFEYMFVFSKGKPRVFNPLKDKKNVSKGRTTSSRHKNGCLKPRNNKKYKFTEHGMRFNVWRYATGFQHSATDDYAYEHPAIFPEALARDHILSWSNEGDIVLDPLCGSGTTLKMARKLNRYFIGFDVSEEYCRLSRKRAELGRTFWSKEEKFLIVKAGRKE